MENFSPELLGWIITGVIALFVVFGLLWGLIRGLKKTAFRGAWIIVTAVIMFLVSPAISNALMGIDLTSLNLNMGGVQLTTITGTIESLISQNAQASQIFTDNPVLLETIMKLPQILINVVIFLLGFWLLKILLWPVWAIISASIFKKKKADGTRIKKSRGAGALVGAVVGLFVAAVTFMPLIGVVDLANTIETETLGIDLGIQNVSALDNGLSLDETEEGSISGLNIVETAAGDVGLITQLLGTEAMSYLTGYNNSVAANVLKYTGMQAVGKATFKGLTTVSINNTAVNLEDEIKNAVSIAVIVDQIKGIDFENITQADLDLIFDNAEDLVEYAFGSEVLKAVGEEVFPYFFTELRTNPDFIIEKPETGNVHVDHLIDVALEELSLIDVDYIKNELKCIARSGKVLNDTGFIYAMITNSEDVDAALTLIDDTVINNFVEEIFDMRLVSRLMPVAINTGVYVGVEELGVTDFALNETISAEDLAANLENTVSSLLRHALRLYKSIDFESDYYVTHATFTEVGALLDTLIDYPSFVIDGTNVVFELAQDKAIAELESDEISSSVPVDLLTDMKLLITNLDDVSSYETEFGSIATAYDHVLPVVDKIRAAQEANESIVLTQDDLYQIGFVVETVENLRLLGAYSYNTISGSNLFRRILSDGIDFAQEQMEMPQMDDVFAAIQTNISNNIDWTVEIPLYQPAVDLATSQPNMDNITNSDLAENAYNYYGITENDTTLAEVEALFGVIHDMTGYDGVSGDGVIVWTLSDGTITQVISLTFDNNIVVNKEKSGDVSIVDLGYILTHLEASQLFGNQINNIFSAGLEILSYQMVDQFTLLHYDEIVLDQTTYEEMVSQFGDPSDSTQYDFDLGNGILEFSNEDLTVTIRVQLADGIVTYKEHVGLSTVNEDNYNDIIVGTSTYTQVSAMMGTDAITDNTYVGGNGDITWTFGTKSITVTFADAVVSNKTYNGIDPQNAQIMIADVLNIVKGNLAAATDVDWIQETYNFMRLTSLVSTEDPTSAELDSITLGMTSAQVEAILGIEHIDPITLSTGETIYQWQRDSLLLIVAFESDAVTVKSATFNYYYFARHLAAIEDSQLITTDIKYSLVQTIFSSMFGEDIVNENGSIMQVVVENLASADYALVDSEVESLFANLMIIQSASNDDMNFYTALDDLEELTLCGMQPIKDLAVPALQSYIDDANTVIAELQEAYATETDEMVKAAIQDAITQYQAAVTSINAMITEINNADVPSETTYADYAQEIEDIIAALPDVSSF